LAYELVEKARAESAAENTKGLAEVKMSARARKQKCKAEEKMVK
jgi:hypothetical protein